MAASPVVARVPDRPYLRYIELCLGPAAFCASSKDAQSAFSSISGDLHELTTHPLRLINHHHPPSSASGRVLTMVFDRLNHAFEDLHLALIGGAADYKPA